ncbi:uncharacterized protein LOC112588807 [Harpegnathos saltator]|uniref:uncharacterized protein LOC112588807 n=1 Tax=Harpegnathos saltator TaxID=610380 RepID=UPI000DBED81F|nr:uncharacterized protein LOC112588807 [Harpegnathos saltator]
METETGSQTENDANENTSKELEKSDVRKQFEKKVRTIGGASAIKHLSNVLVITLTNHFAKQITWDVQRQTEGIKNATFANVIIGTIMNSHETSFNELTKTLSEWLRRAGYRYRYHIKLGSET